MRIERGANSVRALLRAASLPVSRSAKADLAVAKHSTAELAENAEQKCFSTMLSVLGGERLLDRRRHWRGYVVLAAVADHAMCVAMRTLFAPLTTNDVLAPYLRRRCYRSERSSPWLSRAHEAQPRRTRRVRVSAFLRGRNAAGPSGGPLGTSAPCSRGTR